MLLLLLLPVALAIPPLPTEFYGTATIYNYNRTPILSGTTINLYAGNVTCGTFKIKNSGYYGVLTCLGDDTYTGIDEGAVNGQNIIFKMDGEDVQTFGDTVYYPGEYHNVNITPIPACGNNWCEVTESCITCAEDCGFCPRNITGNFTGGGGGGGGASGGGGGGSGGGGGGGGGSGGYPTGTPSFEGVTGDFANESFDVCQEDWICSSWEPLECPVSQFQTRSCTDQNNCTTTNYLPDLNRTCEYAGTCFDYIRNQDETDVDCGGDVCEPCDIQDRCLADFDCKSGFCDPLENVCMEPTCTDDFKNQREVGVDCGGPCPPCEKPTLEKPETVIRFVADGCGPFPWIFVLVASVATLIIFGAGKIYIWRKKKSRMYRKLKKIEQLEKIYDLNRNLHSLTLIVSLLLIAISLYIYYLCEIAVWIVFMVLIIIPLIVATIIKFYVYDEKRKKKKLRKLILQHEDYIRRIIEIEMQEVAKLEEDVVESMDSEVSYSSLDKEFALLLKDIRFLMKELVNSKEEFPFESENELVELIARLHQDKFKEALEGDEKIKSLYPSFKLIEKTHRDILLLFKNLEEDIELEHELEEDISARAKERKEEGAGEGSAEGNAGEEGTGGAVSEEGAGGEKKSSGKPATLNYDEIRSKLAQLNGEEKIHYITGLLDQYKDDPFLLFSLAAQYHRQNNLVEAEKYYRQVLKVQPEDKNALYYLAGILNQQGKSEEAFSLYEKIMGIDPKFQKTQEYYDKLSKH